MRQEVYVKFAEAVRRHEAAGREAAFTKIAERLERRLQVKAAQQAVGYNMAPQRDAFRKGMLSGGTAVAGGSLALSGLTGENKSFMNRLSRILGGLGIAYVGNRYATDSRFRDGVHAAGRKALDVGADWGKKILDAVAGGMPRA